jgi:hypothetical protein
VSAAFDQMRPKAALRSSRASPHPVQEVQDNLGQLVMVRPTWSAPGTGAEWIGLALIGQDLKATLYRNAALRPQRVI